MKNNIKSSILKWLCKLFEYPDYPHSFKDQWIGWSIWDGQLTVSFDLRQPEQVKLLSLIHPRFLGCPQYKTLKIVNENTFYLQLNSLFTINYPTILSYKHIKTIKHKDNDGDDFYEYYWEITLSDNTIITHISQTMTLKENNVLYRNTIEERMFLDFLKTI
jgi:hypothetical protein